MKVEQLEREFKYAQLPGRLQEVSKVFHDLAFKVNNLVPDSPEGSSRQKQMCLTKLWEAKNNAVACVAQFDEENREAN